MNRKPFILLLFFVFTLTLAGCSCQHEWTAADCLNPAVCTKCEETGQSALGHDFIAATCLDPERCSRCGETKGTALGHRFGDWIIGDAEMTRSCAVCAEQESAEIDRELVLKQMLPGHWDFWSYWTGMAIGPYDLPWNTIPSAIRAEEDGSIWFLNSNQVYEGSWKFESYEQLDNGGSYLFHVEVNGENVGTMRLLDIHREDLPPQVMFFTNDGNYQVLRQNTPLEALLEGKTLVASTDGSVNYVTFDANRIASGDIGSAFSGTWHLKPVGNRFGSPIWEVSVRYLRDGEPQVICFQIPLSYEGIPTWDYLAQASIRALGNGDGWEYYRFEEISSVAKTTEAAAFSNDRITGTWVSETLHVSGTEEKKLETTEYSLMIRQDGTATAMFDREYTGTWTFEKVEIPQNYNAYYGYPSYSYLIQLDGLEKPITVETLSYGRMVLQASDDSRSLLAWFNRTEDRDTDHGAIAPELITGQWDAVEQIENTAEGTVVHLPEPGTYTLTVEPDGTFTMHLDTEDITGQWNYSEHNFNSGYCYSFLMTDSTGGRIFSIRIPGQLNVFYEIDGISYGFSMVKQ